MTFAVLTPAGNVPAGMSYVFFGENPWELSKKTPVPTAGRAKNVPLCSPSPTLEYIALQCEKSRTYAPNPAPDRRSSPHPLPQMRLPRLFSVVGTPPGFCRGCPAFQSPWHPCPALFPLIRSPKSAIPTSQTSPSPAAGTGPPRAALAIASPLRCQARPPPRAATEQDCKEVSF